jgi:hypothetical protein
MGKRGNGEGTIYHRKDGRWEARITVGRKNGRRVRKAIYGASRKEVQRRLAAALGQLRQGVPLPDDERLTLAAYLASWLRSVRTTLRPSTYVSYEGMARCLGELQAGRWPR